MLQPSPGRSLLQTLLPLLFFQSKNMCLGTCLPRIQIPFPSPLCSWVRPTVCEQTWGVQPLRSALKDKGNTHHLPFLSLFLLAEVLMWQWAILDHMGRVTRLRWQGNKREGAGILKAHGAILSALGCTYWDCHMKEWGFYLSQATVIMALCYRNWKLHQ